MHIEWVRDFCLSLPHTTEKVQWEDDLVFKVGGKMYAVVALEPGEHSMSFKCSDEDFAALVERPGVVPAPYLARAHWVALESNAAIRREELEALLRGAYGLVFSKLPKNVQRKLSAISLRARRKSRKSRSHRHK